MGTCMIETIHMKTYPQWTIQRWEEKTIFTLDFTVIQGDSAVTPSKYTSVPFPVLRDNTATKLHSSIYHYYYCTEHQRHLSATTNLNSVLLLKSSNKNTESKRVITLRKLHQMYVQTAWNNWLWKFLKKKSKKADSWGYICLFNQVHILSIIVSLPEPLHCLSIPIDLEKSFLFQTPWVRKKKLQKQTFSSGMDKCIGKNSDNQLCIIPILTETFSGQQFCTVLFPTHTFMCPVTIK